MTNLLMLSRFDSILEHDGQADRQTDRQTDRRTDRQNCYLDIARQQ